MGWALTGFVLGSVSVLVVTLTMEQDGQALGQRHGFTFSRGRVVLHRMLLSARVIATAVGHQVRSGSETAGRGVVALSVSVGRTTRALQTRLRPRDRTLAWARTRRAQRRARSLRFEDCLQTTRPEIAPRGASPSTLSLSPTPPSAGWVSRALAVFELVVVIAVAGGAVALAVFAVGWKAARLF